jgi:hypothetical protein
MLKRGAPPPVAPVLRNEMWTARSGFELRLRERRYTPPYSPGSLLILAESPLTETDPEPNVRYLVFAAVEVPAIAIARAIPTTSANPGDRRRSMTSLQFLGDREGC